MLYFTCWFNYPVTSGGRLALQFFALSSHLFCSTTFFQVTYVYIKQPVVLNPISKCNVLVFIGDFPPLVALMTNSYFVPVLLTSYWFMQGLQWGLFSFMRSKPDQTQVDQNCLMSFTIMFTHFFKEYLRVCGTGFRLVKSRVLFSHLSSNSWLYCSSYQLAIWTLLVWSFLYLHRMLSKN